MWSRLSSDRFSAISDRCPSRTTLSAVMTVKPTAAPRSRAPQVAGKAKIAPAQSASGSPPLQLASA